MTNAQKRQLADVASPDMEPRGKTGDDTEYGLCEELRFKIKDAIKRLRWKIRRELRWQLDKRTDFLDKKDNGQFIEDLESFKERFKIDKTKRVLYVGCGEDLTVKRALPQTIYLDVDKVRKACGVRYIRADARAMPMVDDSSVDVLITRYFIDPATFPEFRRVLKDGGILLIDGSWALLNDDDDDDDDDYDPYAEEIEVMNSYGFHSPERLSDSAVVFRLSKDEPALGN